MLDKLEFVEQRYEELSIRIADPEIIKNQTEWTKLVKEHSELELIVNLFKKYKKTLKDIDDTKEMAREEHDNDMKQLAEQELKRLEQERAKMENDLQLMLLPKDPNDEKNVVMEIRAGAGGEEASLFAAKLFRMYCRYAERKDWKIELMNTAATDMGGIKEVTFVINGKGAFSRLKYESGVHRVQRIPVTESGGRIHTSTVTVAVLPEAEEVDVEINMNDLRIDVYHSTGHGGQSVNTTDSAVRITHLPSGLVVTCQDEKSQLKNKEKALRVLRSRLLNMKQSEKDAEYAAVRKSQVGTGERSERIRTYNFPQGRVTDHRIGMTVYQIDSFLEGDCDILIDALILSEQTEKLKNIKC